MAKITLLSITSGYAGPTLYNTNNATIEATFERVLFRDGTAPNQMEDDLDMNGHYILNVVGSAPNTPNADNAAALQGFGASAFTRKAEDAVVTGNWEFDGTVQFDGDITINGDARFASAALFQMEQLVDGATITLNSVGWNHCVVTLAGNRTVSITNAEDGAWFKFFIIQDATGSRTLTWPGNVTWLGGNTPDLSIAPGTVDCVHLTYDSVADEWYAVLDTNVASTSGAITALSIDEDSESVNVWHRAGRPASPTSLTLTVGEGVHIESLTPGVPALDFSEFASGSTIFLVNNGQIMGAGGKGGDASHIYRVGNDDLAISAEVGEDGGDAISGPGGASTMTITNNGYIWGGGGGGGGGGSSCDDGTNIANGGGGGGGAGQGAYGSGIRIIQVEATTVSASANGARGTAADSSAGGAGGAGTETGSAEGGDGGAGGDWGTAGTAGASPTGFALDVAGGAGGAAGKAIELNGGAAPTFTTGSGSPNVKGAVS